MNKDNSVTYVFMGFKNERLTIRMALERRGDEFEPVDPDAVEGELTFFSKSDNTILAILEKAVEMEVPA